MCSLSPAVFVNKFLTTKYKTNANTNANIAYAIYAIGSTKPAFSPLLIASSPADIILTRKTIPRTPRSAATIFKILCHNLILLFFVSY